MATTAQLDRMKSLNADASTLRSMYGLPTQDFMGYIAKGDTGLYTGNKQGLIYAHEKELLLKPSDTKNILDAAFTTRDMYNSLKPVSTNALNTNNVNSGGNVTINEMTVETNDATQFTQDLRSLAIREK